MKFSTALTAVLILAAAPGTELVFAHRAIGRPYAPGPAMPGGNFTPGKTRSPRAARFPAIPDGPAGPLALPAAAIPKTSAEPAPAGAPAEKPALHLLSALEAGPTPAQNPRSSPEAGKAFDGGAQPRSAVESPESGLSEGDYRLLAASRDGWQELHWRFLYGTAAERLAVVSQTAPGKTLDQAGSYILTELQKRQEELRAFEAAHPGISRIQRSPEVIKSILKERGDALYAEIMMLGRVQGMMERGWLNQNPETRDWLAWHYGSPSLEQIKEMRRQTQARYLRLLSEHRAELGAR